MFLAPCKLASLHCFLKGFCICSHNFETPWTIFKHKPVLESPLATLSDKTKIIKFKELIEIQSAKNKIARLLRQPIFIQFIKFNSSKVFISKKMFPLPSTEYYRSSYHMARELLEEGKSPRVRRKF